jgi:tetratricopeptide (TPR) repeat protein
MMQSMAKLPFDDRLGNAVVAYDRYLGKFFWPDNLCVFYPHPGHWPLMTVLAALLGLVVVTGLLLWRQIPSLTVGWLWFLGTLVPVIGLVQVGGQALADRYVYIPLMGLLILVVWGACELARPWRQRAVALSLAGAAVVIFCFVLTRQQLSYWQDNEALYRHALAVTDNNFLAHHNLGIALFRKGRIEEAVGQYQEAILVQPDNAVAHYDLATALAVAGRTSDAIVELQAAIRLQPDNAEAHENLGTALGRSGQTGDAISEYREAVKLKPDDPVFHYDLGAALGMYGKIDEAIVEFQEAVRLKPDFTVAKLNLAHAMQIKAASEGN